MKLYIYIFIILLFSNCSDSYNQVIIEYYNNNNPKLIHIISGEEKNKIIHKKISLKENGDTLKILYGDSLYIKRDYFPSDTLKLISSYLNNKKHGQWKYFNTNGKIDCIMYFNNDLPDSSYNEFYSNGKKSIIGYYKNGLRENIWKFYDSEGEIAGEYKYLNGDIYYSSGYYLDTKYAN